MNFGWDSNLLKHTPYIKLKCGDAIGIVFYLCKHHIFCQALAIYYRENIKLYDRFTENTLVQSAWAGVWESIGYILLTTKAC
mmetsp:Transcript_33075/g.63192  ORF Transcript_33075/g.63192 Transcript_33075/m.63192 type:complete len:82 (+) Transcript_33075:141-386(+)